MHFSPLHIHDAAAWAALLARSFDRTVESMEHLLDWLHTGYPIVAWGAWDEDQLVAQYACLKVQLHLPEISSPVMTGMSLNMCVHPDYRGRGLIKQVSQPVYEEIRRCGGIAGIGFSNAEGVQVDRNSKGYGYQVVGKMQTTLGILNASRRTTPLELTETLPPDFESDFTTATASILPDKIHFATSAFSILHRYGCHPFRQYQYAIWREGGAICGMVVYRPVRLRGLPGVALLGAYGYDLTELLRRWSASMQAAGIHMAHLVTSPGSTLLSALRQTALCFPVPTRSPYYLTTRPLDAGTSASLLDFSSWDCAGGDIL